MTNMKLYRKLNGRMTRREAIMMWRQGEMLYKDFLKGHRRMVSMVNGRQGSGYCASKGILGYIDNTRTQML